MFGFGSDKEDRLKENMDEIKQMINSEEYAGSDEQEQKQGQQDDSFDQQQGFENEDFGQDLQTGFDESEEAEQAQEAQETQTFDAPSQQTTDFGNQDTQQQQQPSQTEQESKSDESFDQRFDSPQQAQEQTQQTQEPEKESEETEQSEAEEEKERETADSRSRSQDKSGADLKDSIPEAPETKEIDVPEIDKGPLFIRQQKFKAARNMIREMDHISREIEEVVSHLEEGIRQDRQTESDAKELLHRLEEDRKGVKDIISPKQE